jgi:hypothetical protein
MSFPYNYKSTRSDSPEYIPAITPAEAREELKKRSRFLSNRPKKTKKTKKANKTGHNIVHKNTDKLFTDIRDKIVKQLADKFKLDIAEIQRIINIRTFNKLTDNETVIRFEYLKEYNKEYHKRYRDIKKEQEFMYDADIDDADIDDDVDQESTNIDTDNSKNYYDQSSQTIDYLKPMEQVSFDGSKGISINGDINGTTYHRYKNDDDGSTHYSSLDSKALERAADELHKQNNTDEKPNQTYGGKKQNNKQKSYRRQRKQKSYRQQRKSRRQQ